MKKTILALAIASTFTSTIAFSAVNDTHQTNVADTEKIVVTANRTPQNKTDLLSSVQVITREDIDLSSAASVAELLNNVNGVQISQTGGAGQTTSLFSRGTNSGHTLVIVDGQRISSATLGQVPFADLSLAQIDHIEVIKGPRAALWGSDAIGGVIQIFTRKLSEGEIAAELGLGNQKQQQASISGAIGHGNGSTTFTASAKSSDGYDVKDDGNNDDDGYDRENIAIVGHQQLNAQWKLNWLAKYDQGETEFDTSFGGDKSSFDNYQWQLAANQQVGNFYQQFFIGQQKNSSTTFGNGITEKEGTFFDTKRSQGTWLGSYQVNEAFSTNVGVDLIQESVDSTTIFTEDTRDIKSVFTRLAYDKNNIILDGALRYDNVENVDSEVTYNLSAGWRVNELSLVSLNIGTGFKAPSFNDLYYPQGLYSYGNPDLVSETSESIELLAKTEIAGIKTEFSVYETNIDNLIEWQPDENFAYHPINVNKAKIKGVELTLSADLFGLNHQVQLNYLDAKNSDTDEPLIRRAKQSASYQMSQSWEKLSLLASVNYQGEREDSEWPGTITLPSNTIVNASAAYQVADAWTLSLKVNNLFDRDYMTSNHYFGQPAQYLLTINYRN